jgi:hypothetical protein
MSKSGNIKGGGPGSRVVKEVGVRNGQPRHVVNSRGVSQIGSSLGNHITNQRGNASKAVESVITSKVGISVPLGNEIAAQGLGVGGGRRLYGQSGSQTQYGPAAGSPRPAGRDILNDFGVDSANVRNANKR